MALRPTSLTAGRRRAGGPLQVWLCAGAHPLPQQCGHVGRCRRQHPHARHCGQARQVWRPPAQACGGVEAGHGRAGHPAAAAAHPPLRLLLPPPPPPPCCSVFKKLLLKNTSPWLVQPDYDRVRGCWRHSQGWGAARGGCRGRARVAQRAQHAPSATLPLQPQVWPVPRNPQPPTPLPVLSPQVLFINTILTTLWPHLSPAIHKMAMEQAKVPLEDVCKKVRSALLRCLGSRLAGACDTAAKVVVARRGGGAAGRRWRAAPRCPHAHLCRLVHPPMSPY